MAAIYFQGQQRTENDTPAVWEPQAQSNKAYRYTRPFQTHLACAWKCLERCCCACQAAPESAKEGLAWLIRQDFVPASEGQWSHPIAHSPRLWEQEVQHCEPMAWASFEGVQKIVFVLPAIRYISPLLSAELAGPLQSIFLPLPPLHYTEVVITGCSPLKDITICSKD